MWQANSRETLAEARTFWFGMFDPIHGAIITFTKFFLYLDLIERNAERLAAGKIDTGLGDGGCTFKCDPALVSIDILFEVVQFRAQSRSIRPWFPRLRVSRDV